MSNVFEEIATEVFELKTTEVEIETPKGKKITFSVKELAPAEMARCLDEFGDIDFLAVIYRSVRDEDGKRMTKEQANRLPADVMSKFIEAYNGFIDTKKKSET